MHDADRLYLSRAFPEVCEPPGQAGPYGIVVRTCQDAGRGGVLVAGSPKGGLELDPEVWASPVGDEFRSLCDKHLTLKTALAGGCRKPEVRDAFYAVAERLGALREAIVTLSWESVTKPKCLPDVGTVVSVGRWQRDRFKVGDRVALRPGDFYLEVDGKDFRCLKDQYEHGEFLYPVTDSVPMRLTDDGPEALDGWVLGERERLDSVFSLAVPVYTGLVRAFGSVVPYRQKEPGDVLTFVNPQDWGLTEDHCLLRTSCLLPAVDA